MGDLRTAKALEALYPRLPQEPEPMMVRRSIESSLPGPAV
jgi:hypothetical protein